MERKVHDKLHWFIQKNRRRYKGLWHSAADFLESPLEKGASPWSRYRSNSLDDYIDKLFENKNISQETRDKIINDLAFDLYNYDEDLGKVAWNNLRCHVRSHEFVLENIYKELKDNSPTIKGNASDYFETERLIIKPFNASSNTEDILKLYKYVYKNNDANSLLERGLLEYRFCNIFMFGIYLKDDNKLIGTIGLFPNQQTYEVYRLNFFNKEWTIQFYLKKRYRKKGYGKESLIGLIEHIKSNKLKSNGHFEFINILKTEKPDIKLIKILCNEDNYAAMHVALAAGFEDNGTNIWYGSDYEGNDNCICKKREFILMI